MALKNSKLAKVGSPQTGPNASGHTMMQLVQPATALPDPGGNDGTPTYQQRLQQYRESVQITQKFSQDWE